MFTHLPQKPNIDQLEQKYQRITRPIQPSEIDVNHRFYTQQRPEEPLTTNTHQFPISKLTYDTNYSPKSSTINSLPKLLPPKIPCSPSLQLANISQTAFQGAIEMGELALWVGKTPIIAQRITHDILYLLIQLAIGNQFRYYEEHAH
eukprot:180980_1